ncbi:Serpin B11 [Thelohanellus kitauei]|uniref:Serpin B11 n=1 Tax=Thelohanellus kitauei TaxID=669202 RepID=A0A0C2IXU7_THEKT|nr:Serpin B11 [Thelohanellus kitauei]
MSFEAVTTFTLDVFYELYALQNSTGNIGFSGTALYFLMGAISIGLRGISYDQLTGILQQEDEELSKYETWENSETARKWTKFLEDMYIAMTVSQSLYYHGQLNDHYTIISGDIFRLNKKPIDASNKAEILRKIKGWYFKNEKSMKIWHVVEESINSDDKILFMSEISFDLNWKEEFDTSNNEICGFFSDDGEEIPVCMMSQVGRHNLYDQPENKFKILFKPFKENKLYAAIVLPKHDLKLLHVHHLIKWDKIQKYFKESISLKVHLRMPKFTIDIEYDFVTSLKNLGVKDIFYKGTFDFRPMTNRSVFIGNILQVVSFSLDEFGVNIATDEENRIPIEEYDEKFDVDRTFLFFIYSHKDKHIHYSAVVNKPTY